MGREPVFFSGPPAAHPGELRARRGYCRTAPLPGPCRARVPLGGLSHDSFRRPRRVTRNRLRLRFCRWNHDAFGRVVAKGLSKFRGTFRARKRRQVLPRKEFERGSGRVFKEMSKGHRALVWSQSNATWRSRCGSWRRASLGRTSQTESRPGGRGNDTSAAREDHPGRGGRPHHVHLTGDAS